MRLLEYVRYLIPGGVDLWTSNGPTFRCLRCGAEFQRQYDTCPDCRARYLAEVEED